MEFGFRKSFSLGRGVRLNICKRGLSVSGGTSGLRAGGSPSARFRSKVRDYGDRAV